MKAETSFEDYEKGKKGATAKKRRGPVSHMTVKPVAGGFVTEADHEDMGGGGNSMMMHMPTRTKKHHKTAEEMGSHISVKFGGKQLVPVGPEAGEESEAAGAGDPNEGAEK